MNFLTSIVLAADQTIKLEPGAGFENLAKFTIPDLVSALIRLILIIAALVAFAFLVLGGIKWITSGGDKEATAKAQGTITAALIGLVIVFAAWAIIRLIEVFFNVSILTLTIPTL
ncbi:MAG: hypothetical protein ACPLKP_02720 [Microgenomates group bacterium]